MSRRVVLVTRDASRTGAPMIALLVARCMTDQGEAISVVSRREGPLLADFAAVAPTSRELLHRVRRRLWEVRVLRRIAWVVDVLAATATVARQRPDLVYLNSSAAAIYLHAARWLRVPALLHVHESEANTELFPNEARISDLAQVTLVACSPQVERNLLARTGRPPGGIYLLLSVPDTDRLRTLAAEGEAGLGADSPVVGATGSVGPRNRTGRPSCSTPTSDSSTAASRPSSPPWSGRASGSPCRDWPTATATCTSRCAANRPCSGRSATPHSGHGGPVAGARWASS